MTEFALTERDAAYAWALAYNTHDPEVLAPILTDDRASSRGSTPATASSTEHRV